MFIVSHCFYIFLCCAKCMFAKYFDPSISGGKPCPAKCSLKVSVTDVVTQGQLQIGSRRVKNHHLDYSKSCRYMSIIYIILIQTCQTCQNHSKPMALIGSHPPGRRNSTKFHPQRRLLRGRHFQALKELHHL